MHWVLRSMRSEKRKETGIYRKVVDYEPTFTLKTGRESLQYLDAAAGRVELARGQAQMSSKDQVLVHL